MHEKQIDDQRLKTKTTKKILSAGAYEDERKRINEKPHQVYIYIYIHTYRYIFCFHK